VKGVHLKVTRREVIATASVMLAAGIAFLVLAEVDAVESVHPVYAGRPSVIWLAPGVYDIDQDPGTGGYPNPDLFSVTGQNGPVKISEIGAGFFEYPLSVLLASPRYAPAASFRITQPGNYRIGLQATMPDLSEVIISEPYTDVAIRVLLSGILSLIALVVLLRHLVRALRQRRVGQLADPIPAGEAPRH
jgi:hypothetical protein